MNASTLLLGAIEFVIVLFSVILHEVAHGLVARQRGDSTAEREGRLTLNPLPHIDLYGTILLPLFIVILNMTGSNLPILGWAKPVPVRPGAMDNPRHDWMMVSLAGPATNLALAFLAAMPLRFGMPMPDMAAFVLLQIVIINISLAVFNLLPLPPLDGSRVVMRFLPRGMLDAYLRLEGATGLLILYILLATGFIGRIISPIVMGLVSGLLGVAA